MSMVSLLYQVLSQCSHRLWWTVQDSSPQPLRCEVAYYNHHTGFQIKLHNDVLSWQQEHQPKAGPFHHIAP